jgi:hypothetical protein
VPFLYIEITDNSENIPNNLLACVLRQRHALNPDFRAAYLEVVKWYLEVENGRPTREIGLNRDGAPIAIGPFGRNDGLWGGFFGVINERDGEPIDKELFERLWNELATRFKNVPAKIMEPIRPVEDPQVLHGLWTTGSGGSMSEDLIAFLPDGQGFFEVINVSLNCYDMFQWSVIGPGSLAIHGIQYFYLDDENEVAGMESRLQFDDVRAEIERKHFGDGSCVEFLNLRLETAQARQHEHLYFPERYYRCPIPPDQIEHPAFPRSGHWL